jgi:uncharacterized protein YgiM (DUF1202 family)
MNNFNTNMIIMKNVFLLFISLGFGFMLHAQMTIQGDVVNVRNAPNVSGAVVGKLKRFNEVRVLEKSSEATVNGITDYWYKIQFGNNQSGYVFGQFTSYKREGQITRTMELIDISLGDCYHLIFDDIDFGNGINNLDGVPDLGMELDREEKIYTGKKFLVTYNNLFVMASENCSPEMDPVLTQTPTIVRIEMVK